MHHRHVRACLGALVAALIANSSAALAASAENGRKVFADAGCWSCHGYVGQGAVTGPKLAPDPMPQETFVGFVRTSSRAMPSYSETVLSDQDLNDIYAYLQSVPNAPDYKSIPLLNQ